MYKAVGRCSTVMATEARSTSQRSSCWIRRRPMKVDIERDYDHDMAYRLRENQQGVEVPDEIIARYRQLEAAHEQLREQGRAIYDELEPYIKQMEAIDHRREAKEKIDWQVHLIQRDYPEITKDELREVL